MNLYETEDLTVEQFNEARQAHYEVLGRLQRGELRLLCNDCRSPVEDQIHIDYSVSPHKKQVICTSGLCSKVDYRFL